MNERIIACVREDFLLTKGAYGSEEFAKFFAQAKGGAL